MGEYGKDEGRRLMSELAEGIGAGSVEAVTSLENVYVELENVSKNADVNARRLAKKQRERELKNLKCALDLELICEEEYYAQLTEYRDKNLRRGSEDWYKYTEEIVRYNKRMADEVEARQREMYATAARLRDELAEKLKTDNAPWYSTVTSIFKGAGERGRDERFTQSTLTDFAEEIRLLEEYRDAITALKALGNIPAGVFDDISHMEVAEGLQAARAILTADEGSRARFAAGYSARESLADSVSTQLSPILNRELLEEAGISSAEAFNSAYFKEDGGEKSAFVRCLEESFESVPDSYRNLGGRSAEAFAEGFSAGIPTLMEQIRARLSAETEAIASSLAAKVTSGMTSGGGAVNNYSSTYNFNASADTTTKQLRAAKAAVTLEKLRGGYGK